MLRGPLSLMWLLFAWTISPSFLAQQAPTPTSAKTVTAEALLSLRHLSSLEFSPDGSRIAFVVSEPAKGEQHPAHLWLFDMASHSFRQLTFSEKSESSPKWSPDGKSLAFLSNRDTNQQIYLLSMSGGESQPLTQGKRSITRFEWSPDGTKIAFVAPDAKTDAEEKKEKDKDDARVTDRDDKHSRVWLMEVASHAERPLTSTTYSVSELSWFPDGRSLAVIATDHPESDRDTERIFRLNVSSDTRSAMKEMLAPVGPIGNLQVSPTGATAGFIGARQDGPSPHDLWILPANAPAAKNLSGLSLDRAVFAYRWRKDSSLVLLCADGVTRKLVRYSPVGGREDIALPAAMPSSFTLSDRGDLAFVGESATEPQELWLAPAGQQPVAIPFFNKTFASEFALAKLEIYNYKSFDGQEIQAALLKPANAGAKAKLPLIALIHGGPTGAWETNIEPWGQLLAAQGYAIFYPNIRGSVGYGQKFLESNRADWGGGDFKDVMAGIDDLIAKGVADPDRLGIGGWSYGGYMAEWAITQTNRFKAAVSGAGMANLVSEYGTEQHPSYDEWFWSVPYEKPEGFLNHSPFVFLKNAKTPTLILQGDADTVDPLGQSQELYRGLKRYGVQAELVVYPREPHGLREEKHLLDRLNRIVAWYQKYL